MSKAKYYVLLILVCVIWGATPACGRMLALKLSPLLLTGARFFCMAVILFAFILAFGKKSDLKPTRHDLWIMIAMGALGVFLHNGLLMTGLRFTTASNTAMIESIGPTITCVLAFLVIGERLSALGWVGIAISCMGALSIVTHGSLDTLLNLSFNKGDLIIVACEAMWSAYTVVSWFLRGGCSTLAVTAWSGMAGALMCFVGGGLTGQLHMAEMNLADCAAFFYLVVFSGIIAFVGWNYAALRVGVSKAGTFVYIIPFAGALAGWLILDEQLFVSQFVGGAVVVSGMIVTTRTKLGLKKSA